MATETTQYSHTSYKPLHLQVHKPTIYQPQPTPYHSALSSPAYDPPIVPQCYNNSDDSFRISRTPSPTPSEVDALADDGSINWRKLIDFNKKNIVTWLIIAVILIVVILSEVYHSAIVKALEPFVHWAHNTPGGFLIPIAILIIISFPPLFGHEFIAVLCGMAWGAWVGFMIVCVGSLLGEIGTFFTFKYACVKRSESIRNKSIMYATLCKVIEDGGLVIAIVARYSALPSHYTTAVFASCGMPFFTFLIAAVASLPTQFANVYIGTTYVSNSSSGKIVNDIVLVITIIVTIGAQKFIKYKLQQAKPDVIYARRKARQADAASGFSYQHASTAGLVQNSAPLGRTESGAYDDPYTSYNTRSHSRTPSPPKQYSPYHSRNNSETRTQIPLSIV